MRRHHFQTPLNRADGLGSAKSGFEHWWIERITAVALLPLTIWFVGSLIAQSRSDHGMFLHWLGTPINTLLMILLLIVLFWHAALGLQVVIEDYVYSDAKIWILIAARFVCFGLAVAGILATLRITFTAWGAT